jgi:putative ABC transport system permease protein
MSIYFKSIFRGLQKQKLTTLINLVGFSIGLTMVMFIAVYLKNELQSDKFHQNIKNIYRVESEINTKIYPLTAAPMADWLKLSFSGIEQTARVFSPFYKGLNYVEVNHQSFEIKNPVFVDPSFFSIFSFPVLSGRITNDFDTKNAVVITEPLARKLFGNVDAIGKKIDYSGKNELTVMAVLKKLPANSSMSFELLLPFASFNDYNSFDLTNWGRLTYQTFVVSNVSSEILTTQINQEFKKQFPNNKTKFSFLSLDDIHFSPGTEYDIIFRHETKAGLYLFMIVAVCILFIALINFVNLTIATSSLRLQENVIRKIEGANRLQLAGRFILEAFLISAGSALLALLFIGILFPVFNNLLDVHLGRSLIRQPWFYLGLGVISLFSGIIAGSYPAIKFSRFPSIAALNSKKLAKSGGGKWNNGLIVFQYTTSIILITATLFINKQMDFIQTRKLGFDKEQILYLQLTDDLIKQKDAIIDRLEQIPGIQSASTCDFAPGQPYSQRILTININGEDRTNQVYHTKVSDEYLKTLGLEIVEGRDFRQASQADYDNFIVNESFVKEYGLLDPFGTPVDGKNIIGVVKDYNFNSLHQSVGPLMIRLTNSDQTTMMVRASSSRLKDIKGVISSIRSQLAEIVPNAFVEIKFLDAQIQNQYSKEVKTQKLLGYFSFFAILISCMGLFGLVILTTNKRTKEIGIRKVNGAKISEILAILNKDFVKWVAIAFVIATPVAYYAMSKWLENFAYKTNLSWWIFALAGVLALGVALLTVSFQSWKAATRNPVEALRYE